MDMLLLAACGLASGFLAGLLGIGGGLVVVPALYVLMPAAVATPDLLPQMAAATSLAAMIPTTLTALAAQWRRGAVDTVWLQRMAPGVCVGAWLGALLLPRCDAQWVSAAFALYACYFCLRLVLGARGIVVPAPWTRWPATLVSAAIGTVSVLVGVGGAVFTVPYLESHAVRITSATATSSGVGLLLSLVAVGIFLLQDAGLSAAGSMTLVWWPGAFVLGVCAVLTVPFGVRVAHRWPVAALKRAFALLLVGAAASALWKVQAL